MAGGKLVINERFNPVTQKDQTYTLVVVAVLSPHPRLAEPTESDVTHVVSSKPSLITGKARQERPIFEGR